DAAWASAEREGDFNNTSVKAITLFDIVHPIHGEANDIDYNRKGNFGSSK
ncbi:hypothetical protein ACJX0J_017228, partial [Zea mays]